MGIYPGKWHGTGLRGWLFPLGLSDLVTVYCLVRSERSAACSRCPGCDLHRICMCAPDLAFSKRLTDKQRPFGNYYGLSFVLYELSTPFLNIHWFCDKLNLTGSKLQLYNGIALLFSFFGCRLVWGTYQSVLIYSDIYTALTNAPTNPESVLNDGKCGGNASGTSLGSSSSCEVGELPMWLVTIYLVGNTALSLLNFYWFSQMVKAVRKRFVPQSEAKVNGKAKKRQ